MPDEIQKILHELKEGLVKIYGDQLQSVVLFGSFARGQGRLPDSDIDVMVVLKGEFNYWEMYKLCSEFVADLSLEYDVLISIKLASEAQYALSKFPLYLNVRKEGVAV